MIKRLHSLVIKSYIGPLFVTFFISLFVLVMQFLWVYIEDLVGKGLEWTVIAELLIYAAAGLVPLALPLAILFASIMTFGDMGEHFELTAMKSAGISLQKIMAPLIVLSIIISIGAFFFSNNVIPYTNLKTGSLLYDVMHQRPELNIKEGIFSNDIDGYSIKIKSKNPKTAMMYDFMIYDHSERRGNPKVTLADSGRMEMTDDQRYMIVTLYHGYSFEEMKEQSRGTKRKYPEHHDKFDKQVIIFELEGSELKRTDEALFKHNYQMKNLRQLSYSQDSLQKKLDRKKENFIAGLNRSKYYRYERKITNYADTAQLIRDSIIRHIEPEKLNVIENLDSLFSSLKPEAKQRVLDMATEYAQNSLKLIQTTEKDLYERKKNIQKHKAAWHEKLTLSFACLIFFFIGAPLGAIIRKGGFGMPFLVSIIFFLTYYVILITGKKLAQEGTWEAWQGMWLSSAFTLPLGIFLTYKATTDSVLFDMDTYLDFLKRPFKVYEIKYKDPFLAFHRNVGDVSGYDFRKNINSLIVNSDNIIKQINHGISGHNKLYSWLLSKDFSVLKDFEQEYDALYERLSIKYRDKALLQSILSKFPQIEAEKYQIKGAKRRFNFVTLTFLYFPVGVLVLFRSYLKLKVLKDKIQTIKDKLKEIEPLI